MLHLECVNVVLIKIGFTEIHQKTAICNSYQQISMNDFQRKLVRISCHWLHLLFKKLSSWRERSCRQILQMFTTPWLCLQKAAIESCHCLTPVYHLVYAKFWGGIICLHIDSFLQQGLWAEPRHHMQIISYSIHLYQHCLQRELLEREAGRLGRHAGEAGRLQTQGIYMAGYLWLLSTVQHQDI